MNLTGVVDTEDARREAGRLARSSGVTNVHNELQVGRHSQRGRTWKTVLLRTILVVPLMLAR